MMLYHGTNINFLEIKLNASRVGKDFGVGFYLTPDRQIAYRQAERKFRQYGEGGIFVHEFYINENSLKDFKVLRFDGYSEEWANFILLNRQHKSHHSIHDYDIVIGPIADDTIGFQIRRYTEGIITKQQFLQAIKYHNVSIQYFFGSERAIKILEKK